MSELKNNFDEYCSNHNCTEDGCCYSNEEYCHFEWAYQQGREDAIEECIEALGNNIWDIAKLEQLKEQKNE